MSSLPQPTESPDAFVKALAALPAPGPAAMAAGCVVHPLAGGTAAEALGLLHAAAARALAASLPRDAAPLLLILPDPTDAPTYGRALEQGLMGYERIHWAVGPALGLILILPPSGTNSYWGRPA